MKHSYITSLFVSGLALLTQCAPFDPNGGGTVGGQYLAGYADPSGLPISDGTPVHQPKGYWDGDGVNGPAKIRLVRSEQKAYFYKGGTLVGVSPISSGDSNHVTPAGHFRVTEKDIDHVSSLYGVIKNRATGQVVNNNADTRKDKPGPGEVFVNAPMFNFLRFNHGIGMHTGFLPGYPASHGCVRLPDYMARKFFQNAKIGTPVIVE